MKSDLTQYRIFLTGATGFIGSHLLKRLIKEKCEVHISIRENSSLWRISDVLDKCKPHIIDLTDSNGLRTLFNEIKPEILFHLAAYGVDYNQQNIINSINTNIISSINLFTYFNENKGLRFIHTGSSLEYGFNNKPTSESDLANPIDLYGITKNASVRLLSSMAEKQNNSSLIILRPFSIFGEFEGNNKFFPYIISGLRNGLQVELTTCEQVRDYLYIDDLIDAYMKAAITPINNKFEIINVGSGKGIRLKEIAFTIAELTGSDKNLIRIGSIPYRPNEIMYLVSNNMKAKALLKWEPKIPLRDGLKRMLSFMNQRLAYEWY